MQHGGCGAWHALCHGPVYVHGSCERAVCVKCGHVGREEVRGRKKWDVEPQSPRVHARVRVAPAMRARVWTVETSEKGFAARVAQTTLGTWTSFESLSAYLGPRMMISTHESSD